jgi:hypothetical protein
MVTWTTGISHTLTLIYSERIQNLCTRNKNSADTSSRIAASLRTGQWRTRGSVPEKGDSSVLLSIKTESGAHTRCT